MKKILSKKIPIAIAGVLSVLVLSLCMFCTMHNQQNSDDNSNLPFAAMASGQITETAIDNSIYSPDIKTPNSLNVLPYVNNSNSKSSQDEAVKNNPVRFSCTGAEGCEVDSTFSGFQNVSSTNDDLDVCYSLGLDEGIQTLTIGPKDTITGGTNFDSQNRAPWLDNKQYLIKKVKIISKVTPKSTAGWFGCDDQIRDYKVRLSDIETIDGLDNLDMSECTNAQCMFNGSDIIKNIGDYDDFIDSILKSNKLENAKGICNYTSLNNDFLNKIAKAIAPTATITDFAFAHNFHKPTQFTSLDLGLTDMKSISASHMFYQDRNLEKITAGKLISKGATNIQGMFQDCERLTTISLKNQTDWNTGQSISSNNLFKNCWSLSGGASGQFSYEDHENDINANPLMYANSGDEGLFTDGGFYEVTFNSAENGKIYDNTEGKGKPITNIYIHLGASVSTGRHNDYIGTITFGSGKSAQTYYAVPNDTIHEFTSFGVLPQTIDQDTIIKPGFSIMPEVTFSSSEYGNIYNNPDGTGEPITNIYIYSGASVSTRRHNDYIGTITFGSENSAQTYYAVPNDTIHGFVSFGDLPLKIDENITINPVFSYMPEVTFDSPVYDNPYGDGDTITNIRVHQDSPVSTETFSYDQCVGKITFGSGETTKTYYAVPSIDYKFDKFKGVPEGRIITADTTISSSFIEVAYTTISFVCTEKIGEQEVNVRYFPVFNRVQKNVTYYDNSGLSYQSMNSNITKARIPVGTSIIAVRSINDVSFDTLYPEEPKSGGTKTFDYRTEWAQSKLVYNAEGCLETVERLVNTEDQHESHPKINGVELIAIWNAYKDLGFGGSLGPFWSCVAGDELSAWFWYSYRGDWSYGTRGHDDNMCVCVSRAFN
ncbi:MAG: hypothetical protein Q4E88_06790 [Coriobacteriia bacterium]|nr:hypothetical protein [Coriobacteriia bacterium]